MAAFEEHSGSLTDTIKRVFPLSAMYTAIYIYNVARYEGSYETGPATIIADFSSGSIQSPVIFARLFGESISKSAKYPDTCAPLQLRAVAAESLRAITTRELYSWGTIRKDLQLLTRDGTVTQFLFVMREWAPLAEPIVAKEAALSATVQLMARSREACEHCGRDGHSKERCWQLLKEQGKDLPPEAKFFGQRRDQRARVDAHYNGGASKDDSVEEGRKKLTGILARPEADKMAAKVALAIKDICDTLPHDADVMWTIEKKSILRARMRAVVYDVAVL
ncbi:hypothetical protein T484DRAFT_1873583 [Baffinella frigidus]|nr:hypothetical protein T484DRAFT_1873583 [Cryptophyta sp. CCMP2293]